MGRGSSVVDIQTTPDALRAAGRACQQAVDEIRGADCGGPVGDVAGALPGSKAAGAASSFGSSWTSTFQAWCSEAGQYAHSLSHAADTYADGEHQAQQSVPGRNLSGPR